MADGVVLDPGAGGSTIYTDETASGHVQVVKLAYSADGVATHITADANGLAVMPTARPGVDLGDVTINNAVGAGAVPVQGPDAIDAALTRLPLVAAGRASTATPAAVSADDDVQALWVSRTGVLQVGDAGGALTVDNGGTFAVQVDNTVTVSGTVTVQDGGGAITVDNAGTFAVQVDGAALTALQLIDNLVLLEDAGHASGDPGVQALSVRTDTASARGQTDGDYQPLITDGSGRLHVNVGTSALPTGASSAANQTTIIGHLDGVEGSLTTLAGAVSGTEMQVDVLTLPAIPAGNNNIGDVDVLSVVPGTGATALGKAIDSAGGATDTGVAALAIRDDALATLTPVEGDYVALRVDDSGALWVHTTTAGGGGTQYTEADTDASITGTAMLWEDTSDTLRAVSAAKPLPVNIVAGAGSGGTASTDDAAFTAGSGSGTPMMGFVTADSVDSGDVGVVGMLANRQLKVTLYDSGGVELSVGGGTQYTEDAAAAANPIGNALNLIRADSLAAVTTTDGDNVAARGTNNGELYVKHVDALTVNSHAVTNAGTFVVQENGAALTALQVIDNPVVVDDAAFTPATTSVMMAGATFDDVAVDSVNEGDAGALRMSANRNLYMNIRDAAGNERGANVNGSNQLSVSVDNTVTVASHAVTNAGTFVVQENGAALTALQVIDNPIIVDDAAFTVATTSVSMIGGFADETSPDSVNEGDGGAVRMSLERFLVVTPRPTATGEGLTIFRSLDLDETEEDVKTSAGKVYGYTFFNAAASTRYLKFYNATAANVTVGSTTPVMTIGIPAGAAGHIPWDHGIAFSTAITVAATTGIADADTGAPAANDVSVQVFYV